MKEQHETVIIGGGQAGVSVSYSLKKLGIENVVLEKASQAANAWRNNRWDSFTFVTPNWSFRLPGAEYNGPQPNGYLSRSEIISEFEKYIESNQLPVKYNEEVVSVDPLEKEEGLRVTTLGGSYIAKNVVIATGIFQSPRIPPWSAGISTAITQLSSNSYRNPAALPPGAVLVVGSGQSGSQIAEELYQSGRRVYLCISSAGRVPRRYRGKDIFDWLYLSGFFDLTADKLPSPKAKFSAMPHVTGKGGGHNLNLHQFKRDGVVLLGHLKDAQDMKIWLAPDLSESLAKADQFEASILNQLDNFIASKGMDAPREEVPVLKDGYQQEMITELDLASVGISTIIWAMGHRFGFDMLKIPVLDSDGFPIQDHGVTPHPGLFFAGMPWMNSRKSGLLVGVPENAGHIASKIKERVQ